METLGWIVGGSVIAWIIFVLMGEEDEEFPAIPKKPSAVPAKVWKYRDHAVRASNLTGEDPDFILAVLWRESGGDEGATNSAGERGLMQMTPIAMEDVTGTRQPAPWDPYQNVYRGAQYLRKMRREYTDGSDFSVARGYNEGPPPFTKAASASYAQDVLERYEIIQDFWNSQPA